MEKSNADAGLKSRYPQPMDAYSHYIVKHIVLDKDFNFMTEHMFDPAEDKAPILVIAIGIYRAAINVLSVCNKHDTCLNTAEV